MNVNKIRSLISYLPELSFFVLAVVWFFDGILASTLHINYITIGLVLLMVLLVVWKEKIYAISLSVLLGLGSLYMLLAVFSEYAEFSTANADGMKLLIIGGAVFSFLIIMAFLLPRKYIYAKQALINHETPKQ